MFDLSTIDDQTLLARGVYSTIRAAHEDEKKKLQMLCGQMSSIAAQVMRQMQPDNDAVPPNVDGLLESGRETLNSIDACTKQIESLAQQRAGVKQQAWGRK